jgi:GntR family transcriptional regulator
MGIDPGAALVIRRRVLHNKETDRVEEVGASYVPEDIAGGTFLEEPTVVPKALFLCVEELSGKKYASAHDQWIARMPTPDEADVLDLAPGAPVIHLVHTARAKDGTVLEVSESLWPADRICIFDDYPITQKAEHDEEASDV